MCCPEYGSCSKLKDLSDSDITKATSLADLAATKYVKVWPGLTYNTQLVSTLSCDDKEHFVCRAQGWYQECVTGAVTQAPMLRYLLMTYS